MARLPVAALVLLAASAGAQDFDTGAIVRQIRKTTQSIPQTPQGGPLEVVLNRFWCAGSGVTAADMDRDLDEARKVFARCGVGVKPGRSEEIRDAAGGPCPANFRFEVDHDAKTLSPSQRALFARYHRAADGLSVFYLPWSSMGPAQAGTSIPEDYIRRVKENNTADRAAIGALAVFQRARVRMEARFTLPHEMGHILTDNSDHTPAAGNLMDASAVATGSALTADQCARIARSPFVRR